MPIASRLTNTGTLLVNGNFDEISTSSAIRNLLTYTEQFNNSTWANYQQNANSVVITANVTTAPDGTLTANKFSSNNATATYYNFFNYSSIAANTTYTFSTYFKSAERTAGGMTFYSGAYNNSISFDLAAGTITGTSVPDPALSFSSGITSAGNGWYRIYYTFRSTVAQPSVQYKYGLDVGGLPVGHGYYIWGAQLELAGSPSNYQGIAAANTLVLPPTVIIKTTANTVYASTLDEFIGAPVADTSLKLWLDAAQPSSYSGSGATWTDLSGNGKNYTLVNSPTFNSITGGGVITFAGGSTQYANAATTLFNSTTTNTYTINIWVYPTAAGQIVSIDGQSAPNTSYHYSAIEITAGGVIYFGQWTGSMTTIATSAQSLNAWYNLVITYNGTTATAYVNGASVGFSNIIWSAPGAETFFALMAQDSTNMSGSTAYPSGNIGAFMVYNRALTTAEVVQNYNALRNRYTKAAITTTQMPAVQRRINSGTLLINSGVFDEWTGAPVADGNLKVWLDAGQTTSYSGSGTTWSDLSGTGNNGTLVGSPTYNGNDGGGSITTAAGKYISTAYNIPSNTFTISMFVALSPSSYWATIWGNESYSAGRGYLVYLTSASNMVVGSPTASQRSITVSNYSTVNHWAWVVSGTTITTYKNGVQVDSGTFAAPAGGLATTGLYFGARHVNDGTSFTDVMPMTIYNAMVYDRVLTADEITTNFNALRSRYGI